MTHNADTSGGRSTGLSVGNHKRQTGALQASYRCSIAKILPAMIGQRRFKVCPGWSFGVNSIR